MLCYVMLCYVTLRYVTLRYVTLRYVMLCYVMLRYVMLCYVMLCYVMLCYVMLRYVTLRYVTLRYVTLCYVIWLLLLFMLLMVFFFFFFFQENFKPTGSNQCIVAVSQIFALVLFMNWVCQRVGVVIAWGCAIWSNKCLCAYFFATDIRKPYLCCYMPLNLIYFILP